MTGQKTALSARGYFGGLFTGSAFGYLILSPAAMLIAHVVHAHHPAAQMAIVDVLGSSTPLWTGSFTFLGGAMGVVVGHLFFRLEQQSNDLKQEMVFRDLVMNSISDHLLVIDRDFKIIGCNDAFAERFGGSQGRIVGRRCFEVSHNNESPCGPPHDICPFREVLNTGKDATVTHVHQDEDGNEMYVEVTASPIRDDDGNITGIIEVMRDRTEQRKLQAKLLQAQKLEAVGLLAGGIAHDFNNYLGAIGGYAGLLQMKLEDATLLPYAQRIMDSVDKAAYLTKGLLALGRKEMAPPGAFDLAKALASVQDLLDSMVGEDIEFAVTIDEGAFVVLGDANQIEQVVLNLVVNARDAMPKGGLLNISLRKMSLDSEFIRSYGYGKEGDYAVLTVSDTGHGIDKGLLDRIFEPFFTTKDVGQGTGLGLSIVYGIVKQHHGYLTVQSRKGVGTTFSIYLPLRDAVLQETVAQETNPHYQGNETILVADDNEDIRSLVSDVLTGAGYRVIQAGNGEEALAAYVMHREDIALLVLDVVMPKMNGRDLFERLKVFDRNVKVVFISGYSKDILTKKEFSGEGMRFLAKPFHPRDLLEKIRDFLDGR